MTATGLQALSGVGSSAGQMVSDGMDLYRRSLNQTPTENTRSVQAIQDAGAAADAAARAQAAQALSRQFMQARALAASGGPLAQRQAMADNSMAGAQVAQDLAAVQAQNRLATGQALAGQYDTNVDQNLAQRGLFLQQAGLGANVAQAGYGTQISAATPAVSAGVATTGQYLDAQQQAEQAQLAAALSYEQRRQQEAQRRSQNLWNFGAGLVSGGARTLGAVAAKGG
jgi:hypothetical protein